MENKDKKNIFTMPAEWEKHKAVYLAWPYGSESFENRLDKVEQVYIKFIQTIHKYEIVKLLVLDQQTEDNLKEVFKEKEIDLSKIIFIQTDYADVWLRDYGPIYLKNSNDTVVLKNKYDGYGGKFANLLKDNYVFYNLKSTLGCDMIDSNFVLEGGAIDVNGKGTLITTEQTLLENRNKNLNKKENEEKLKEIFNVPNVIWLKDGLTNDHTDGHIDEIARFVSPTKIVCAYEDDEQDANYEILKNNFEILESALDQDGNKFVVIKLPMPHMTYDDGSKAPVSYTNFYIGNSVVIMSIFNDVNDKKAMEIIQNCFPEREVVGIDCTDLIYGGGALHCITQQEVS